ADVYTVAANDINTAVGNAKERIDRCGRSTEECGAELAYLTNRVTSARNTLETARTASAAGALARAAAQKKLLDEEIVKVQAQMDAQAKADAKKDAAAKAQTVADTKKQEAADAQKKAEKTPDSATQEEAKLAQKSADDAQKAADAKRKEAKEAEAEAKVKADADARAAATAPVSPACLTAPGKVILRGTIVSFTPSEVQLDKVTKKVVPINAEVRNVDLRNVSDENLSIDIGGNSVPIVAKVPKNPDDPYSYIWIIRFVPPDKRPKDTESEYAPSLIYVNEPLANAQTKITYP